MLTLLVLRYALGFIYANHGQGIMPFLLQCLQQATSEITQHGACLGLGELNCWHAGALGFHTGALGFHTGARGFPYWCTWISMLVHLDFHAGALGFPYWCIWISILVHLDLHTGALASSILVHLRVPTLTSASVMLFVHGDKETLGCLKHVLRTCFY